MIPSGRPGALERLHGSAWGHCQVPGIGDPSAVQNLPAQGTPAAVFPWVEGLHEEGADPGQALPGAANW